MPGFEPLPAQVDLPVLEHEMLARWQAAGIFERSLQQTEGGPAWIFYEGPPTANGRPGVHHVEARTFKDLFPRFKTMQGYHVPRQAGWDCHGLPVEVAVEKELGLTGKRDIEAYGVAEFNERCRESVLRYVGAWLDMSWRMGYWADSEHAYRTMDPSYIESVWWSLKVIYEQGLLVRDFRISPYCPRCGTPLSDHEMGQEDVYQTVSDPAITVRFPLLHACRPGTRRRRPSFWAPTCSCGPRRRGRWSPTPRWRFTRTRRTWSPRGRGTAVLAVPPVAAGGWWSRRTSWAACSTMTGGSSPGFPDKRWWERDTTLRSAS